MGLPSLADISSGLGDLAMGFVNDANLTLQSGLEAHETVTGIDTLGWAHERSVQQAGDDRRADLYAERERESIGFAAGYEPPTVAMENFESMPHEQMKAAVDSTQPGSMLDDARAWRNAAERIQASVTAFNESIRGAIDGGWEGTGAESARSTVATYAQQSLQLEHAARLVANKIEEAHTGIEQARQRMPEPEQGGVLDVLRGAATLDPIGGLMAAFHKAESVRQEAVQVMTTEYAPVVLQADSQVPILPVPHGPAGAAQGGPTAFNGDGTPTSATGSGTHGESSGVLGAPGSGTVGDAPSDTTDGSAPGTSQGTTATDDLAATGATAPTTTATTDPAPTTTATTDPAATAPAAHQADPTATRSSTPSGGTAPASFGSGAGTNPIGGAGATASPGLVAPLVPGTQATHATSTPAPTTLGGRGAVPGMGAGFLPPAAARRGEDDTEHDTPEYLLNAANGNELIGHLPKVAPPVLGG